MCEGRLHRGGRYTEQRSIQGICIKVINIPWKKCCCMYQGLFITRSVALVGRNQGPLELQACYVVLENEHVEADFIITSIRKCAVHHRWCGKNFHFYCSSTQLHIPRFVFSRRVFWCNRRHIMSSQLASFAHKPLIFQKCELKSVRKLRIQCKQHKYYL